IEGGKVARVSLIEEGKHPELAGLIAAIKAERGGRLANLYRALLNSPAVAEGWLKLFTAVRQKAKLAGRCRELAILRVALLNGADYEYRAHVPFALKDGVTQGQIDALSEWQGSKSFDDRERVELTATVAGYNLVSRFLVAMQIDQEPPKSSP